MSVQNQKPWWVTHFKLDEAVWDSLLKESFTANCTPLALACEKSLINESEYLLNEQARSELPVLSAAFFDIAPPPGIFSGYDFKDFKKEGLLPLSSWENHTLFAKTSSEPSEFQNQLTGAIFILAPWTAMQKWYDLWEKQQGIQDSPQGLQIAAPPSQTLSSINFGEIKLESVAPVVPPPQDISSFTSMIQITPELKEPTVPTPAPAPAAPAPVLTTPPPPIPAPQTKTQPYPTIAVPDLKATTMPTAAAPTTAPPPLPKAAAAATTTQKAVLTAIPFDQIVTKTKAANTLEELYNVILGCWKNYFDRTMIFSFSPAHNKLTSVKWEGAWKITDPQKTVTISTASPSIFKIPIDTNHPYHGYVVPNPANQAFFDAVNEGQIPEHVTITCINQSEKAALMIFGACSKDAAMRFNINQIESLTDTFSQHFQKLNSGVKLAG